MQSARARQPASELWPLTGQRKKRRYAVLDLESKDGDTQRAGFTRVFFAGMYDGRSYRCVSGENTIPWLMRLLLRKCYLNTYFYAHNGGKFDFLHFLPWVVGEGAAQGFSYEITPIASSIQILDIIPPGKHGRWRFLDSHKLIPISLMKAAKTFKVTEKMVEHSLDMHEKDPAWKDYNRVDCVSLYEVLERFHELVETRIGGEVGITTAATAMKTFRRKFQVGPIARSTDSHEFVREGYYGGRVEVLRRHASGLHYYDINSCYPHVMCQPMPAGEAEHWRGKPPAVLRSGKVGFARARVEVPADMYFPPLPYRLKDKLVFPTGSFSGVWDVAELEELERVGGRILEWGESVWYPARNLFEPMMRKLYEFRDTSRPDYDDGLAYVAKILANSLYGKFGMRQEREKIVPFGPDLPIGSKPADPKDPECPVWYTVEHVDTDYIIPQISAHVTALARLTLYRYAREAMRRGGVLAYVDTDSIITTSDMSDYVSTELGGLKDEGKGVTYDGVFLQPKLYMLCGSDGSTKVVMKGFHSRSPEVFEKVRNGETIRFETLEKIGTLARRGFKTGPMLRTVKKSMQSADTKRLYLPGGDSRPLVIRE